MANHPLQLVCLGVIVGAPVFAAIFVLLRIYARRMLNQKLAWDDWFVIAASILLFGLIAPSWIQVKITHTGWHIWDVRFSDLEPDYNIYYAVQLAIQLINIPILPMAKVSIILLLLRAGSVIPLVKRILYGSLIFTIGSALVPWCLYIFICPMRTGQTWELRTFGGLRCLDRPRMGEMLIWVTVANLITDLFIIPIPFMIMRNMMSASLRSRLAVLATFLCGLFVTAIGAAKIYMTYEDRIYGNVGSDFTYNISFCVNHIENCASIIMATVPVLRGLITRWVSGTQSQSMPDGQFTSEYESKYGESCNSRGLGCQKHRSRFLRKMFPRAQDMFRFTLTTQNGAPVLTPPSHVAYPPGISQTSSYLGSSDPYVASSACEQGEILQSAKSSSTMRSSDLETENEWKEPM